MEKLKEFDNIYVVRLRTGKEELKIEGEKPLAAPSEKIEQEIKEELAKKLYNCYVQTLLRTEDELILVFFSLKWTVLRDQLQKLDDFFAKYGEKGIFYNFNRIAHPFEERTVRKKLKSIEERSKAVDIAYQTQTCIACGKKLE